MEEKNKMKIGVFGNDSSDHLSEEAIKWIENLGKELAINGSTLYTGGGGGIMHIIRKSCIENKGFAVSVKPELFINNDFSDDIGFTIVSGLGKTGRSSLIVQSIDIGISIGGGSGTLMEIIACYLMGKPVIIIDAFHKKYDPKIKNILNRIEEVQMEGQLIQRGYIDSKDISSVEPVTVCYPDLTPEQILRIGATLYEGAKKAPKNQNI